MATRRLALIVLLSILVSGVAMSQPTETSSINADETQQPEEKSTAGFEIEEGPSGLKIKHDGSLVAGYVLDQANKPYLWPIIGPTGKPMTRAYPMKMVSEELPAQRDHPHHRGLLFGHERVGLSEKKFTMNNRQRLSGETPGMRKPPTRNS